MFTRTAQGLSNLHLFYGVDFVAFAEGGTETDVARGGASGTGTPDELFWQGSFETIRPDLKVQVVLRGSKTTLQPIAEMVARGELSNVVVCMDADYEHVVGTATRHRHVIYTWGYSWENDVIDWSELENIAYQIAPVTRGRLNFADGKDRLFDSLGCEAARILLLDVHYQSVGVPLKNKSRVADLVIAANGSPALCRTTALARLRQARQTVKPAPMSLGSLDFWRNFHGKTLIHILWEWMHKVVANTPRALRWSKAMIQMALIRRFHAELQRGQADVFAHYRNSFAQI
jgi:hypothetical protein